MILHSFYTIQHYYYCCNCCSMLLSQVLRSHDDACQVRFSFPLVSFSLGPMTKQFEFMIIMSNLTKVPFLVNRCLHQSEIRGLLNCTECDSSIHCSQKKGQRFKNKNMFLYEAHSPVNLKVHCFHSQTSYITEGPLPQSPEHKWAVCLHMQRLHIT